MTITKSKKKNIYVIELYVNRNENTLNENSTVVNVDEKLESNEEKTCDIAEDTGYTGRK